MARTPRSIAMRIGVFSTQPYDREFLTAANKAYGYDLVFHESRLTPVTAPLIDRCDAVCVFVNDELSAPTLAELAAHGCKLVALRCAGFNNVDLAAAAVHGVRVVRVPAYSPNAVAEHALAMILALNRKLPRAFNRVREGNFSLEGLLGFDLAGVTVGVVGTGKIGAIMARLLHGFGCKILAYDLQPNPACLALGAQYVPLDELYRQSKIITLHCPLTPQTHHLINARALALMQEGVMLINTGRGGLIDTPAVVDALKSRKVGYLGLDVYEEEATLFYHDHSQSAIQDDTFARLLTFPNVLITGHQGFFTRNALEQIAATTLASVREFEQGGKLSCEVRAG